jgi:SAM-dependent methyltransferase
MDLMLQATFRAERDHFWFRGFRRFVRPLVARALAGVRDPVILDCGCGTGANLAMLGEFGRAFGFDLTWTGLAFARQYGQTRVARATVASVPFPSDTFDLTTSFDVLYCLEDEVERKAVEEMFRMLKPGGAAIFNVAALDILHGDHSVLVHEVRRTNRRRMRTLLEGAGFSVTRMTYTNCSLFPFMLGARLVQRMVGLSPPERADADIRVPAAPVNAALSALLALEAAALRWINMPVGSSLLCLAHKPR